MIELIHGDCRELMAKTPDKFYDLAIIDPPYGIGEHGGKDRGNGVRQHNGNHRRVSISPNYSACQ